ncbi:dihydrofolate reductase [Streptomyces paradoxus]|uniref:Dihydrofolate reductase n=1 Tax=Streptomyces paradoxus TaxID=66375 RepID=A0A7W9WH21_9ACTN|nr:dihydrofolate reductase [Streptomyces paradoxus]
MARAQAPPARLARREFGTCLCGGSKVAGELFDEVDELVIKTYPLVYGTGMPMSGSGFAISEFTLESVRTYSRER